MLLMRRTFFGHAGWALCTHSVMARDVKSPGASHVLIHCLGCRVLPNRGSGHSHADMSSSYHPASSPADGHAPVLSSSAV